MDLMTSVVRKVDNRCGGTIEAASGWAGIAEAVGGNQFTARDGKVAAPSRAQYPPSVQRHPRTGVGVTADGRVLIDHRGWSPARLQRRCDARRDGSADDIAGRQAVVQPRWRWLDGHGSAESEER